MFRANNKEINENSTIIENEITTTTTVIYNQIIGTITTMLVLYIHSSTGAQCGEMGLLLFLKHVVLTVTFAFKWLMLRYISKRNNRITT